MKRRSLLFNPKRSKHGLILLVPPIAYVLLVSGFKGYWLDNDLRHLYKEILKPYYRRICDEEGHSCVDYRDLKDELYGNVIDE